VLTTDDWIVLPAEGNAYLGLPQFSTSNLYKKWQDAAEKEGKFGTVRNLIMKRFYGSIIELVKGSLDLKFLHSRFYMMSILDDESDPGNRC